MYSSYNCYRFIISHFYYKLARYYILRYSDSESITDNGIHYGVEVLGLVFDNLSRQGIGLPRGEWINDFSCRSGKFDLEELDNL